MHDADANTQVFVSKSDVIICSERHKLFFRLYDDELIVELLGSDTLYVLNSHPSYFSRIK